LEPPRELGSILQGDGITLKGCVSRRRGFRADGESSDFALRTNRASHSNSLDLRPGLFARLLRSSAATADGFQRWGGRMFLRKRIFVLRRKYQVRIARSPNRGKIFECDKQLRYYESVSEKNSQLELADPHGTCVKGQGLPKEMGFRAEGERCRFASGEPKVGQTSDCGKGRIRKSLGV